jgi:hypothetical protein
MRSSAIIQQFTADLLSRAGAIVEPVGLGQLDVLPGPDLGVRLGIDDLARLTFESGMPGGTFVDYDAPLVDRLGDVVAGLGRMTRIEPPAVALKALDAHAALERSVALQNGVFRCRRHAAVQSTYVGVALEYTVLADERMGGLVLVWVNPAARSIARFGSRFDPTAFRDEPGLASGDRTFDGLALAWPLSVAAARAQIEPDVGEFLQRLSRRRDRDVRRLREYYEDIDLEIRRKLAKPRLGDDQRRRDGDRLAATHRAYRARAAEVADRYRARLRLSPVGVWLCRLPAYQIAVTLMRRSASADVVFSWNPLDGRIEQRACDGCFRPVSAAWLCDDAVHYVCEACLAPCGDCGRRFCRACVRACPRPHSPATSAPSQ